MIYSVFLYKISQVSKKSDEQLEKLNDPVKIAIGTGVLAILLMFLSMVWGEKLTVNTADRLPWVMSSSTILLYTMFNTIGLMVTTRPRQYWSRSVYGLIGLMVLVFVFSGLFTGVQFSEIGDFKSVLLVLMIAYLVLMAIGNTVRLIVRISREQDKKKLTKENENNA
jgi:cytochrome bd-type quinol oxidase subunit 1